MNNFSKRRRQVRKLGFRIYTNYRKAVLLAWIFSRINQEVNWVVKEPEGYMVINLRLFERLNKLKEIGHGNKMRTRDIDKVCVYRSRPKSWGKLKVNPTKRLQVVSR